MIFLLTIPGIFIALLAHELGHCLMARLTGVGISQIRVGLGPRVLSCHIGGCEIILGPLPLGASTTYEEFCSGIQARFVAAGGPAANVLLGMLAFSYSGISLQPDTIDLSQVLGSPWSGASLMLSVVSFAIAAFNVLPVRPLDGAAIVSGRFVSVGAAGSQLYPFWVLTTIIAVVVALLLAIKL